MTTAAATTGATVRRIATQGVGIPYPHEGDMSVIRVHTEDGEDQFYTPWIRISIDVDDQRYTLGGFAVRDRDECKSYAKASRLIAKILDRGVIDLQHWDRYISYQESCENGDLAAWEMAQEDAW